MNWIEWQGKTWPTTENQAELRLHLWPPDSGYPRPSWSLKLSHVFRPVGLAPNDYSYDRWAEVEISELFFHASDWRRLSRQEIRATPAWHDAHEHFHQHHQIVESRVNLFGEQGRWRGHDFILRVGTRDGLCFPCELDTWLIPEGDYPRKQPEDPAEIAPFASTPPNLRVITSAVFVGGTVEVPGLAAPTQSPPRGCCYAKRSITRATCTNPRSNGPSVAPWITNISPDQAGPRTSAFPPGRRFTRTLPPTRHSSGDQNYRALKLRL